MENMLELLISFLQGVLVPVVPAAVLIALFIDHVLKRLPFWKDGWGGKANVLLNMLFSAMLFIFAYYGEAEAFLKLVGQLGAMFTVIVTLISGVALSGKVHEAAWELGVGKSISEDAWVARMKRVENG